MLRIDAFLARLVETESVYVYRLLGEKPFGRQRLGL